MFIPATKMLLEKNIKMIYLWMSLNPFESLILTAISDKTNRQVVYTKAPSFISRYYPADKVAFWLWPMCLAGLIRRKKVFGSVFLLNLARTYADKIPIELCIFR